MMPRWRKLQWWDVMPLTGGRGRIVYWEDTLSYKYFW